MESLKTTANEIVKRQRVADIIDLTFLEDIIEKSVRKYGKTPAVIRTSKKFRVQAVVNEQALAGALQKSG